MKNISRIILIAFGFIFSTGMIAQNVANSVTPAAPISGELNMSLLRWSLILIAIFLAFVIVLMGRAIQYSGANYYNNQRDQKNQNTSNQRMIISIAILFTAGQLMAQSGGISKGQLSLGLPMDIFLALLLIFIEIIVIATLTYILIRFNVNNSLVKDFSLHDKLMSINPFSRKYNKNKWTENDEVLDLKHDYDGISELDNKVPGWWSFAFYGSILFGVVYLYMMFVSGGIPDQFTELARANEKADVQKTAFLASAGSNIDESNVKMLDATGVKEGHDLFEKNCVACHGTMGEGNAVGPNLTDDYWIHGGSIKNIFTTIKYGVPEKGMKTWKDDFSPQQIAELASFIKSIHGTNPPNAKDKQGELYKEDSAAK